ncbi:Putative beta-barrel porin-2, OmpL-like. bbp2 [Singulisphaera sp. GP187]|uniref:outer membrane beta-barrel protein n=1 Tax=Singulisphaera sp. GP187 TaxID=1882752 RepID=UPI000927B741|nr:outer membrane beta-barrel protein [Singulisphaera sp. GP187]SIO60732.1 Putative beta-barrel porin-2, OmpL-like. bbp2 [Singulisphaera sp. GP187]
MPQDDEGDDDEEDDDDEDEDDEDGSDDPGLRSPVQVGLRGADRRSSSPMLNREGPIGSRPGKVPGRDRSVASGGQEEEDAAKPEPYDNENGDGFLQPDLLMKALGFEAPSTRVYGWVEGALLLDPAAPRNHQTLPNSPSDLANRWQVPQAYLAIERVMKNVDSMDYGFRFDNLIGTDFVLFNDVRQLEKPFLSNGFGYTPTQWYADLHLPILTAGGLDLRFGQFISLAGYESAFAPGRPLRSTGLLFNYSHPFTNVGLLTTLNVSDQLQIFNAPVNGWDRLPSAQDQWGYMGGINWDSKDERTNLSLAYYAGPNQITRSLPRSPLPIAARQRSLRGRDRGQETTLISAVLSHDWNRRWTTVFEVDGGAETGIPVDSTTAGTVRNSTWYGAGNWILYTINDRWTGVVRSSLFRDQGGVRTGFNDTYFETALGLIYKPTPWFWIRPEIDYDGAIGAPPFETRHGRTNNEFFFGFDALFLF